MALYKHQLAHTQKGREWLQLLMVMATAAVTYRIAEERDVYPVRLEGRLPSSKEEWGSGYLSPAEIHRACPYLHPAASILLHMLNEMFEFFMLTDWKYQYFAFNLIEILSNGPGSPGCLWVWWVGGNLSWKEDDSLQGSEEVLRLPTKTCIVEQYEGWRPI